MKFHYFVSIATISVLFARPGLSGGTSSRDASFSALQGYAGALEYCARPFFDPDHYDIYSYENTCSQPITIHFVDQVGHGGSMDLQPGAKGGTGDSREVMSSRTYQAYVCPLGFVAVDFSDKYVTRPYVAYRCKGH